LWGSEGGITCREKRKARDDRVGEFVGKNTPEAESVACVRLGTNRAAGGVPVFERSDQTMTKI